MASRDMETLGAQIDALHSALQAAQRQPAAERREQALRAVTRGAAAVRSAHVASQGRPHLRVLDGGRNDSAEIRQRRRRAAIGALLVTAAAAALVVAKSARGVPKSGCR